MDPTALTNIIDEESVKSAIYLSKDSNSKYILLSPACSSFDQYANFEQRGNHFKEIINSYQDFKSI